MGTQAKRIVIVGGGVAGASLAKSMQSIADVVLIDPKEYFEIPWTELRSMVEPSFSNRSLIMHSEYLNNARIILSSAVNITENMVLTADGHSIVYDYLVIATGHAYGTPVRKIDRMEQFAKDNEKIKSANSILIVGGGPTGVELAAEIAVDYPGKKVTIVHKGSRLMEFVGPKASSGALNWLTTKNVDVLLNQSVQLNSVSENEKVYITSTGEKITADCHYICVGKPLGSSWLRDSILRECLDKAGRLTVDENLQVKHHNNIFAIGDITDIPELKQGYIAQEHAKVAAKNLKALINGEKDGKLTKYKPGYAIAIVSLGRKEGIAQFPFMTTVGCIPGIIKSKDLFVSRTRKNMGLNA